MFLALTTKDAFPIISFYYPDSFFFIISKCYCLRRANICTCLASDTILIINNRFASEVFERNMRFVRELRCIGRSDKRNQRLFYFPVSLDTSFYSIFIIIFHTFFSKFYPEMVGSPDKCMSCNSRSKEKYRYCNQSFCPCITQSEMEDNSEKNTAATQRHSFCCCLKSVVSIRKSYNSNATKKIEE